MKDTNPINLLTLLNSYGDIIELNQTLDSEQVIKELEQLEWEQGPNGKQGINLTGPEKGLGLDDKNKHEKDQPVNENLLKCTALYDFFTQWSDLARCRAVKLEAGSFFTMHRDAFRFNPQIRIFVPLNKTEIHQWNFLYDTKRVEFKPGVPYVLNTRKQHGSFAMEGGIYHILMSLYLTEANLKTIINSLPNCKEK